MVKKIFFALILINLIGVLNVKAAIISPTSVYATFDDDTVISSNYYVSSDGNYFASNTLLGGVSSAQWVKAINFYYNNINLCPNQQMTINGKIRLTNSFFQNQSYSLFVNNNNASMSCSTNLTTVYQQSDTLEFSCVGTGGGTFSVYFQQNTYTTPTQYDVLISRDLQYSCDITNGDIINSQNQNTQSIINNNTTNSQNIINNQNQNTQEIIDNQNSNTDKEIESQQVCNDITIDKSSIIQNDVFLDTSGNITSNEWSTGWGITDYLEVTNVIKLNSFGNLPSLCFYNSSKTLLSCSRNSNILTGTVSLPINTTYIRASINITEDKPQYTIKSCKNGNQALSDNINNLNDTLNDTSQPNTNQDINDMDNMVASDTPISDLITMPLTLVNAYINGINSSCSSVNLGNLYGTDLILPCINLEQRLGSNLWHTIDSFFSIFMCYNIGMLFITAFDGITSLRDDFEGLYQPRHADTGYKPKHGG